MSRLEGIFEPVPREDAAARYIQTLIDREDEEMEVLEYEESAAEALARQKQSREELIDSLADHIGTRYFTAAPMDRYGNREKMRFVAEWLVDNKGITSPDISDPYIQNLVFQSQRLGHAARQLAPIDRFYLMFKNHFAR